MTYSEKLKDPRWQKKRLEILERDDFTCQKCRSADKTLHVHHKEYRRGVNPWEYEDSSLITLCEGCHVRIEDLKNKLSWILADIGGDDALEQFVKAFEEQRIEISRLLHYARKHPDLFDALTVSLSAQWMDGYESAKNDARAAV